ncbi:hypothetical protein IG631_12252 [Alternaria alternata]|nr:hypothetical protein IG631_12252 [Alternaria alternata]
MPSQKSRLSSPEIVLLSVLTFRGRQTDNTIAPRSSQPMSAGPSLAVPTRQWQDSRTGRLAQLWSRLTLTGSELRLGYSTAPA